jgi:hypothetical protein
MSISPQLPFLGYGNTRWVWTHNYGWSHYEDYYWKVGHKTHAVSLAGGTPWRYPTEYHLDIYNVKTVRPTHTIYPDGGEWYGTPVGGSSDAFYVLNGGGWAPGNASLPNFDANLVNGAITKALNQLANQKADIGSNIAEGKQTLGLVAQSCSQVWKAMLALKRREFKRVASELGMSWSSVLTGKFPANRWLEYQFGWKPLLQDIKNGYDRFHESVSKDLLVSGSGGMHAERNGEFTLGEFSGPWSVNEKASCRIDAHIDIPEMRQANQWNLINPLSVAWELVPWSFAVDWFIPVGNTLEASSAKAGLGFVSGSTTQHREHHQTISFHGQGGYTVEDPGEITIEKLQMKRYQLFDFPDPEFYAKTSNPFTSTHSRNALALWRQIPPLR